MLLVLQLILEGDLNMLVLPTLIPAALKLLALPLVLSEATMMVMMVLNTILYPTMSWETLCLIEVPLIPMSLWILEANLLVLLLSILPVVLLLFLTLNLEVPIRIRSAVTDPLVVVLTDPMVDVLEAIADPVVILKNVNVWVALDNQVVEANLEYVEEAAYKYVDVSEYVFPTQGGTVRTEDVSEASSRSSSTIRLLVMGPVSPILTKTGQRTFVPVQCFTSSN